jgi:uncharacterized membrane protein
MERFGLGKVMGTGFRVWLRNLVPFLLITTVIYVPYVIWVVLTVQGEPTYEELRRIGWSTVIVVPLLNILVSSALVYGVVMELKGQRASMLDCLTTGLGRFFPVLGVAILTMLAIAGGLLLFIVPGLIVTCVLYVTTQVAVLERPGVFGALSRSSELTRGHRWQIFAIVLLVWLLNYAVSELMQVLMVDELQRAEADLYAVLRRYFYLDLGRTVLMGSLSSVMASSAYYYLRLEKEGTSADELSRVFE